ncbi:unnamed protein product, partial [Oppiella nova]
MYLLGIAKGAGRKPGLEKLFLSPNAQEIILPEDSNALHLLQRVRDEAHRFAITGHRQQRAKRQIHSVLENIEGVGAARRRELLRQFGGLQEVQCATVEELAKVPGISVVLAKRIYDALNRFNLPNLLTLLRIFLIPIFILAYYTSGALSYWLTTSIFVFACLTDWFDGYLARKLRQESRFGAFLDPVADKLIVVVALILLVQSYGTAILSIPAVIIISREIVISALRELMAQYGRGTKVAVAYVGKIKTFMQMSAIAVLQLVKLEDNNLVPKKNYTK